MVGFAPVASRRSTGTRAARSNAFGSARPYCFLGAHLALRPERRPRISVQSSLAVAPLVHQNQLSQSLKRGSIFPSAQSSRRKNKLALGKKYPAKQKCARLKQASVLLLLLLLQPAPRKAVNSTARFSGDARRRKRALRMLRGRHQATITFAAAVG